MKDQQSSAGQGGFEINFPFTSTSRATADLGFYPSEGSMSGLQPVRAFSARLVFTLEVSHTSSTVLKQQLKVI